YYRGSYFAAVGAADAADADWKKAILLDSGRYSDKVIGGTRSWYAERRAKAAQSPPEKPNAAPVDAATIKRWVNDAAERAEKWGNPFSAAHLGSRLPGKWIGGKHVTLYNADGTFVTDPDISPRPTRQTIDRWSVQGDQLITTDVT